jgi:hypothetical protein
MFSFAPVRPWDSFGPGDLLLVRGYLHLAFKSGDQCTISPARGNCEMILIEAKHRHLWTPSYGSSAEVFFDF